MPLNSSGGCYDQGCALEIGKLLSVQYMVFGTVNRSGASYIISIKKVNVESSRIEINPIDTMVNITPAQMKATTRKLAYQMAGMEPAGAKERIQSFTGSVRINITTPGAPVRPPRGQGFISLFTSPPGMNIIIDGEILDETTPLENHPLNVGDHEIILSDFVNSFFNDREIYVTVRDGESEELSAEMERKLGKLLVSSSAEGASVFINGKKEGTIKNGRSLITSIPTGAIEVTVRLDRYRDETRQVALGAAKIHEVTMDLAPLPVRVIFESNPQGAEVTLNGEVIGKTPVLREDVPQGRYTYSFTYDGYTTEDQWIEITGIEDKTIIEDLAELLTVELC